MFALVYVIILILNYSGQANVSALKKPTIFVAILARNKEHTLPYFLSLLEEQDYPKDRLSLWIRSDHNRDSTPLILKTWADSVKHLYHSVNLTISEGESDFSDEKSPVHWPKSRFNHVINIREEALNIARKYWADYIMVCVTGKLLLSFFLILLKQTISVFRLRHLLDLQTHLRIPSQQGLPSCGSYVEVKWNVLKFLVRNDFQVLLSQN